VGTDVVKTKDEVYNGDTRFCYDELRAKTLTRLARGFLILTLSTRGEIFLCFLYSTDIPFERSYV